MPYTPVSGTAAVPVSIPPPAGQPHAVLFNYGQQTAWLGQAGVSSATGFPLPPNNEYRMVNAAGTVYAVAGFGQIAPFGTANAATSVGGSTVTVASGGTAFGTGSTIVVEPNTARQEIAAVFASNAGTVTATAAFTFAHGSGTTFSAITPYLTTVRAERGAS